MNHDRRLTTSAFPGDEGKPSPRTRELFAALGGDDNPQAYLRAVTSLCADRLLHNLGSVRLTDRPRCPQGAATNNDSEGEDETGPAN